MEVGGKVFVLRTLHDISFAVFRGRIAAYLAAEGSSVPMKVATYMKDNRNRAQYTRTLLCQSTRY